MTARHILVREDMKGIPDEKVMQMIIEAALRLLQMPEENMKLIQEIKALIREIRQHLREV